MASPADAPTHAPGPGPAQAAKDFVMLAKDAGARWADDSCYRLGASLSYYALYSIFPLLLLSVTAVGFFLSGDDAREKVLSSVAAPSADFRTLFDQTLQSMQSHRTARGVGTVVGFGALLVGASGVFSELQSSLDLIWRVEATQAKGFGASIVRALKDKAAAFAVVVGAAIALLASLAISTTLQAIGNVGDADAARTALQLVEVAVSFIFLTGLFATIYRIVPQTDVKWRDVFGGAVVTSFLFSGLKWSLAWYLAHIGSYAAYGAVGGVLGLLTWIYVASLILLYGAEFCRVYAERYGSLASMGHNGSSVTVPARTRTNPSDAVRGLGQP
jgi:membrane protein